MNQKMMSYVLLVCAAISYARSIYFDSHFLVQFSIMNLIGGLMGLIKHYSKDEFRYQIARGSVLMMCYGLIETVFFVSPSPWIAWGLVAQLCGVGSLGYIRSLWTDLLTNMRGIWGGTVVSICVVVGLRFGTVSIFFGEKNSDEEIVILPTYDRITTFSTGQTLTGENWKNIISTGILPISGQSYFQFYDTLSKSKTTK